MDSFRIPGLPPIPPLGLGTWQWGDRWVWGYGRGYGKVDLKGALWASLEAGVRLLDTAEIYGLGQAERFLGRWLPELPQRPLIVSKFFPWPWRLSRRDLLQALRGSLRRLGLSTLDLYLLHWPWPPRPLEVWAEALAEAYERGLARAVGVSNCGEAQLERALKVLQRHRVPLAANQVEYSLLNRGPERSGLKAFMEREGIALLAYSPLAMGWLTGKYRPEAPPPGTYRGRYRSQKNLGRVLEALKAVAQALGATPAQVALAWVMAQGALPIAGAKNPSQAQANAQALALALPPWALERLEEASRA